MNHVGDLVRMLPLLPLALTLAHLPVGALAAEEPFFEAGIVRAAAEAGEQHSYPVVIRTGRSNLFTVWTKVDGKSRQADRRIVIVGAFSKDGGRSWGDPKVLIQTAGMGDYDPNVVVDGNRILVYSTTTPVPQPVIDRSDVWMTYTEDEGVTWTKPAEIKTEFKYLVGKRHIGVKLKDGTLAMPFSWDLWAQAGTPASTEGEMDLKSGILVSKDRGLTWTPRGALHIFERKIRPGGTGGLCEPALVELANGDLYMLFRTGTSWIYEARSRDRGGTWSLPTRSKLQGYNAPMALWRLDQDPKEVIVIYDNSPIDRFPLCVAISGDGGKSWSRPKDVAGITGAEVSYPGITQAADGAFVAVWQQTKPDGTRDIRYARFNRAWVLKN